MFPSFIATIQKKNEFENGKQAKKIKNEEMDRIGTIIDEFLKINPSPIISKRKFLSTVNVT